MAGGFNIAGLQLHKVLQGAHNRYRELQDEDWKVEKERRDQIVAQLSGLIPHARTGVDIEAINADIAQIMEAPREKQARSKLLKTPSIQVPKPAQAQPGAGAGGATPPPFDFKQLAATLMGGGAPESLGMPDVPQSAGGLPDSISAVPPTGSVPPGGPQPAQPSQMVPPVGAGSLGATGAPTPQVPGMGAGLTPPAPLPQVMTPPGRSVPEPSPLVGTLPGTPSPTPAPAGPQMVPQAATPPPVAGTPPPSPFMGYIERARLPYELNAEFGMSKTGRPIGSQLKPLLTIKDMVAAARAGRTPVPDPDSPTGYSLIPIEEENLTPAEKLKLDLDRSKLKLDKIRGTSIQYRDQQRDKIAAMAVALQRERLNLAHQKNAVSMGHWVADTSIKVAKNYEQSVRKFEEAKVNLAQIEADLLQATGPADYMAIVTTVHAIDDTAAREGEVQVFRGAASLPDRLDQIWGRATEGDLLNGTTRAQMQAAIQASYAAMQPVRDTIDQRYCYTAHQLGLDSKIIGVPGCSAGAATSAETSSDSIGREATPPPIMGATPSSPKAPAALTGSRMSKTQTNKRTGARRTVYSDDGGRTWHP